MAGVSTPELAATVSESGALGSIAIGAVSAEKARELIAQTRERTARPFNVNAFAHLPEPADPFAEIAWIERLRPWFQEFGAEPPAELVAPYKSILEDPEKQQVLLETAPAVVSFHFGLPDSEFVRRLQEFGSVVMACVTTVSEALQAQVTGVDAVVAQGFEAGGHRGNFAPQEDEQLSTLALVPQVVRAINLPVIAAGGVVNGAGMVSALALGACGIQCGTAFVGCPESSAPAAYRQMLASERASRTQVTSAISGRPARGIRNRFIAETAGEGNRIPGYPKTYHAGKALAEAAARSGDVEFSAMWAGQAAALAPKGVPAREVVDRFIQEARECWRQLSRHPWLPQDQSG